MPMTLHQNDLHRGLSPDEKVLVFEHFSTRSWIARAAVSVICPNDLFSSRRKLLLSSSLRASFCDQTFSFTMVSLCFKMTPATDLLGHVNFIREGRDGTEKLTMGSWWRFPMPRFFDMVRLISISHHECCNFYLLFAVWQIMARIFFILLVCNHNHTASWKRWRYHPINNSRIPSDANSFLHRGSLPGMIRDICWFMRVCEKCLTFALELNSGRRVRRDIGWGRRGVFNIVAAVQRKVLRGSTQGAQGREHFDRVTSAAIGSFEPRTYLGIFPLRVLLRFGWSFDILFSSAETSSWLFYYFLIFAFHLCVLFQGGEECFMRVDFAPSVAKSKAVSQSFTHQSELPTKDAKCARWL